jgi:hypothetical protein
VFSLEGKDASKPAGIAIINGDDDDDDELVVTLLLVCFCVIQVWCENVNVPKRTIGASPKIR